VDTATSSDGTAIAFDRSGEGAPVVLVGGAFQTRMDPTLVQLAALLAPDFTVFAYDRRGRGDSGDSAPYATEREVDDLGALIEAAGGSAFVWGISSGGVLALDAARNLAIAKLALYEPPFVVDDTRPPLPPDYVQRLDELVAAGRRGAAVEYAMSTSMGMPAEFVAPMRDAPFWSDLEAVAHTLAYDGSIMGDTMAGNPLPANRWSTLAAPTLVIDGGTTPWMTTGADALAAILPAATRATLAGQPHNVDPAALAPVLVRFFSG
jgi:pimeloyl-ACP methyl ester carboxylesterase